MRRSIFTGDESRVLSRRQLDSVQTQLTHNDHSSYEESYTAAVAYDTDRREARTIPNGTPPSKTIIVDQIQTVLSLLTFFIGIQVGLSVLVLLLPSILHARSKKREDIIKSSDNISSTYGGSRTAIMALLARSQMNLQRIGGPDYLAPRLMERLSIFGPDIPGSARITATCARLSRINFGLTNRIFEDQVAYMLTGFNCGVVTPMHVRTCWLDDCVESFVRRLDDNGGILDKYPSTTTPGDRTEKKPQRPRANVVILGSGFDTRCYRLNLTERNIRTFEVDAPGTQSEKKRVLREANIDSSATTFCPCDFTTQDWLECLVNARLDACLPTMVVWEGVTMYIPERVIVDTLRTISTRAKMGGTAAPWCICFDYVDSCWAMSPIWTNAMKRVGEPFKFAMVGDDEPETLVRSSGLRVMDHLRDERELARRYIPTQGDHRPQIGIMGGRYGGFMLAGNGS